MKKIISTLLTGTILFGANLYHKELPKNNLPIIFKISTQKDIISTDINNNNTKILVATKYKIKIFNLNTKELEKVLAFDNIKKVKYSNDSSKIFILTEKNLFIYDANNYHQITSIKGKRFETFTISNNDKLLAVYDYSNDNTYIYDLITGNLLSKIHNTYIKELEFSPNNKKIAIMKNNKIFIYTIKGVLTTTLPQLSEYIQKVIWIDNQTLDVLAKYYSDSAYVYRFNIITSQIETQTPNIKGVDDMINLDSNDELIAKGDNLRIFNFNNHKFIIKYPLKNKKYTHINDMDLSNNHQLLAIAYNKNVKLYKTNFPKIKTSNIVVSTPPITKTSISQPQVIIKEKIVEKKVYINNKHNIKPTVEIYASQTSGIVPLKVNFRIIANDEDGKIVSYYINFAGKEVMAKGNPTKPFNYTFQNAGNYKIMVAVKDNKGAITTKQIIIKAREESFKDFEKDLLGN